MGSTDGEGLTRVGEAAHRPEKTVGGWGNTVSWPQGQHHGQNLDCWPKSEDARKRKDRSLKLKHPQRLESNVSE